MNTGFCNLIRAGTENRIKMIKSSWAILEGSPETGGLPGLFLVKTCLVILPALVVIYILQKLFGAMRRKFS